MKRFKSLTAVVLAGFFAVSAVGCGGSSAEETTDETAVEEDADTEAEAEESDETAALTGTEGLLIWGTNAAFEPYEYMEGDVVVGIDAEIADAIAEKLGLTAQVENMDFDAIIPSVTTGKVDIGLAGMTVNEERLNNVNFSEPYVEAGQAIIVPEGSDITSVADLEGKIIGVQRGTTGDEYVSTEENGVGAASVERFSNGPDAAQSLLTGKIDAIVLDDEPSKKIVANSTGLVILDELLTSEQYAIAVAKDNTALLDGINAALAEMEESGELQEILDKYLNSDEDAAEE
ncbi:MAG: basic amino acid ABC transporter substrate-binding protein [Clostridiales bacterium]|nr:basic amino acid ABC transporter substrate-binding protein [Clostridiales bacterium]